ncbi:hypothetical protein PIB30_066857 [Stylosanthes scabra]|uniref:Uncharacterized protein n=1 Tax=Stylosanthes scabra TaxID=79078 RepID=A0ABU6UPM0_9FABA|nr:hypothetical protein [Stylosanthes scabra]
MAKGPHGDGDMPPTPRPQICPPPRPVTGESNNIEEIEVVAGGSGDEPVVGNVTERWTAGSRENLPRSNLSQVERATYRWLRCGGSQQRVVVESRCVRRGSSREVPVPPGEIAIPSHSLDKLKGEIKEAVKKDWCEIEDVRMLGSMKVIMTEEERCRNEKTKNRRMAVTRTVCATATVEGDEGIATKDGGESEEARTDVVEKVRRANSNISNSNLNGSCIVPRDTEAQEIERGDVEEGESDNQSKTKT